MPGSGKFIGSSPIGGGMTRSNSDGSLIKGKNYGNVTC